MKRNVEDPGPAGVQAVFIAGRFPPRAKMMPAGRQQPSAFDVAPPETARKAVSRIHASGPLAGPPCPQHVKPDRA